MGILLLTLVRATSSMFSILISLSVVSLARSQVLTCPTGVAAPSEFYIIGASGGDSTVECENTAAATTKGLQSGMNAVELDISVSRDNVVFLWNDPNPADPVAQARSSGLFVAGLCNPRFNTLLGSRDMVFSLIKQNYFYVNASGVDQGATIPTLWEWMDAQTECYGLANVGQTVSSNGWRQYQNIVSKMVTKRDEVVTGGGNYIPVIGWRINQIEKITWMICAGVDGIYTDNIGDVKSLKVRQANNDITCCMEDKITPCLPPYDPRLMGQGCSSMGLTYYDLETAACPLVGIDLLYTGTQLTCRQLKFCPV